MTSPGGSSATYLCLNTNTLYIHHIYDQGLVKRHPWERSAGDSPALGFTILLK